MNQPRPMPPSRPQSPPIRYEIVHRIALDPDVFELLHDFLNPEIPMTKQELVDLIKSATDQITTLMDSEHNEVLAAIEAFKNGDVPAEVSDAVQALIDAVKGGIPKILDVVTAPADGGTVTPVPAPAPTPPDAGTTPTPPTP